MNQPSRKVMAGKLQIYADKNQPEWTRIDANNVPIDRLGRETDFG
jgi:hypothetical protein